MNSASTRAFVDTPSGVVVPTHDSARGQAGAVYAVFEARTQADGAASKIHNCQLNGGRRVVDVRHESCEHGTRLSSEKTVKIAVVQHGNPLEGCDAPIVITGLPPTGCLSRTAL